MNEPHCSGPLFACKRCARTIPLMPLARTKLKAGDPAPDIFLPAANGQEISLRACVLEGPVLVEFIRGTWCPEGRKRLKELAAARGGFREERARILVVVCEDPRTVERYLAAHPSPLTVLLDQKRLVARAYGVHQRFGLAALNIARPASFLIDRAGFIRRVFVAKLPIETAPVEEILTALRGFEEERARLQARGKAQA
jgi:peroxiredoxin